jgi:ribosomal protein S27E
MRDIKNLKIRKMKNYIIKIPLLMFALIALVGCADEQVTFDTNQTLVSLTSSSALLATPEEGLTVDLIVNISAKSDANRAIQIEIDPSSTATPDQYTISDLVIPAGSFLGTIKVTSNFSALPEMGSSFLTVNITDVENTNELVFGAKTFNLEFFRLCPVPAGDYILELNDSFGDGWDGAIMRVTIDGVSTDFTGSGFGTIFTVNAPDGTETLVFTYLPGSFESEHTYIITSPNAIVVSSDGPRPTPGDILFNTCNI